MIKRLFLLLTFTTAVSFAQKVTNPAFENTLKVLLNHSVPQILVDSAKTTKEAIFLDAREKKEFEVSHINHAKWVGYSDFNLSRVSDLEKDQPIIIYCSVGYRSEKIGDQLVAAGFTNVHNLYGGIFEWFNQKQPVYSNTSKTNKIHAYDNIWGVWLTRGEKVY